MKYRGVVSGFSSRIESPIVRKRTTIVWNFRLERRGEKGELLPRVAVEMRGKFYRGGSVNNGDVVEIEGTEDKRGLVSVTAVNNLTSRTRITAHKYNVTLVIGAIFKVILLLVALAIVTVVAIFALTGTGMYAR